jgi:hypothetical protein
MSSRAPLIIVARPAGEGRYDALLYGRVLVRRTRQALLDGARALVAEGVDPGQRLVMRHQGSVIDALLAKSVAAAAKLTVEETGTGPRFRLWKPFQASDVSPSVAPDGQAALGQPPEAQNAPARRGQP